MRGGAAGAVRRREGPKGLPFLGSLFPFLEDPLAMAMASHAEYGDVVKFYMRNAPILLLRHPRDVRRVLLDEPAAFPKPRIRNRFNGNGLTVSQGEFWKRQRGMVQPLFAKEKVRLWAGIFSEELRHAIQRWQGFAAEGRAFDMYTESARMMFRVMWRTCFDEQPSDPVFEHVLGALQFFGKRNPPLVEILFTLLPVLSRRPQRVSAAVDPIDGWIYERLQARRERGPVDGDITLLSMLVEARARDTGEGMEDRQIRDEIVNLFGASFEMIATAITWAVHVCIQHPEVVRGIRDEVHAVVGTGEPGLDDVPKLPYTYRIIQETIRVYPPAWVIVRSVGEQTAHFGEIEVEPETRILMFPYAIHRHPEFWTDADTFDPDRFLPERAAAQHKCAYVPFGAGQRLCVGQHMSMVESVLAVATMLQSLDLEYAGRGPVQLETQLTLIPKGGLPVRAKVRPPS